MEQLGRDALIGLAEKFGIITAVKNKLIKRPDPATDKLVTALVEIGKVYEALNTEITRYLSVTFDDGQSLKDRAVERAHLVELEGGEIDARMASARGHCKKIKNIYDRYLVTWFDGVLSPNESGDMRGLFEALEESDALMVDAISEVSYWLSHQAEETLSLVDNGKFAEADAKVKQARSYVLPHRKSIANAMRTLFDLEAEFISISGAV